MKASDILKLHRGEIPTSIQGLWKKRVGELTGTFQQHLTGKESGQLQQLQKFLGPQTRPVVEYVINNWWKFASQAGAQAGTSFPTVPTIGFVLKHYGVAVNLLTPQPSPAPPVEESSPPLHVVATDTKAEPVHELTSQELTDLLDEFDALRKGV